MRWSVFVVVSLKARRSELVRGFWMRRARIFSGTIELSRIVTHQMVLSIVRGRNCLERIWTWYQSANGSGLLKDADSDAPLLTLVGFEKGGHLSLE
jgi:hypothetical protein